MDILYSNWEDRFNKEIAKTSTLRIISPFLSRETTRNVLQGFKGITFELITRYNLKDFVVGVSSIPALKELIQENVDIYGVTGLHSKVYIFDDRVAIVSSANLTQGGLRNNEECGILITSKQQIHDLIRYFNELRSTNEFPLTIKECENWETEIDKRKKKKEIELPDTKGLNDYGKSRSSFNPNVRYFLKFLGESDNRVSPSVSVRDVIANSGCHYMLGYPENKKPSSINDGDIIFISRMASDPNDHIIFGRAIAIKFDASKYIAKDADLKIRPWLKHWPVLLRIKNVSFIDGNLTDGISLNKLVEQLDHNIYRSTQDHYHHEPHKNTDPRKSIMQKAGIELTYDSSMLLENIFQSKIDSLGKVDQDFLNSDPAPN